MKNFYVYILASKRNGTLYVGVTNDIGRRIFEHKQGQIPGFTKKYHVHMLVYAEEIPSIKDAITREKQLKGGNRKRKIELIESMNPGWLDLYPQLL